MLDEEKVESVLHDMRIITAESAFVVRTFFFIIFGWSVFLGSLLNIQVIATGVLILIVIYLIRAVTLFVFNGKDIALELFLAPRGLVTILLFFAIPEELALEASFQGVLLFVVLVSCLIMAWSLISYKKKRKEKEGLIFDNNLDTPELSPEDTFKKPEDDKSV